MYVSRNIDSFSHSGRGKPTPEKKRTRKPFPSCQLKLGRTLHPFECHIQKYLKNMKLMLFTDGSVNTKLKVGYGAYLVLSEGQDPQTGHIKLKQFTDTSSTKLELQTLLWALSEITSPEIISYTDSQNIVGLNARRKKIEGNHYYAKSGKLLNNHELYRQFYQLTDNVNITFIQIRGHTPSSRKSHVDLIFSLVDRASRNALRAYSTNYNLEFSEVLQKK
ncbi:MAG: ribonuclease HI [Desulforhopalus sp.]